MPLSYRQVEPPAAEPVSLREAKKQLNIDDDFEDDDDFISDKIVAARQYVEQSMCRAIFNRKMRLSLDFFPYPTYGATVNPNDRHSLYGRYWHQLAIRLPMPSAVSVESITYMDLDGTVKTLDSSQYKGDYDSDPARILPAPGLYWPYTQSYVAGSVKVNYTAGSFGDGVTTNTCPRTITQAILLLASYWYNHRDAAEATPPKAIEVGVESLLSDYNVESFGY